MAKNPTAAAATAAIEPKNHPRERATGVGEAVGIGGAGAAMLE